MVEILVDSYLSNAVRSKNYLEVKHENIRLDKYIYQKYGIDSLQFAENNAYYTTDVDGYLLMLKDVESRLNELIEEEDTSLNIDKKVYQEGDEF